MEGIPFQTRARTIDHLGRGQIADAPTAISELWKNAYDAYAKDVALHIFDGEPDIAAIFDNGVGMSRDEVINRWLVVGTESKIETFGDQPSDTLGLPLRPRQGEKGIGRLSVAFLAPITVLVTKKTGGDFVTVVVDWRLFENPFISLDDIRLPVESYKSPDALAEGLPTLVDLLRSNLGGDPSDRGKRLADGWARFSLYETKAKSPTTTEDAIRKSWATMPINRRHLDQWETYLGLAEHGTAMFMSELNHELGVWVRPYESGQEVDEVKTTLRTTLTGFTDPYAEVREPFTYEVFVHNKEDNYRLIGTADVFGRDNLVDLEHYIDGQFDEQGTFTGRIVAFGQDLGIKTYTPLKPLPTRGKDRLGKFTFTIGTYEVDERRSTHSENEHANIDAKALKFAGVFIYRDSLRVMPYGRPDADFLQLEERRSRHAGREFWAHRRSFGRIAVSRAANPALKDKAGREGLVDNRAFREMRILVIEFLMDAARKYFGTDASLRDELLPGIMERKALQKAAADTAKTRRRKTLREFLRDQAPPLTEALSRAESLIALAKDTLEKKDRVQATVLASRTQQIRAVSDSLRPPVPASRLGDLEDRWREYRDGYQLLLDRLQELTRVTSEVDAALQGEEPKVILVQRLEEQESQLKNSIAGYTNLIDAKLNEVREIWRRHGTEDAGRLRERVGYLADAEINTSNLLPYLNIIEANRTELADAFSDRYRSFLNTLDQLAEGIDLEGAYSVTEDDRAELEEQLRDIRAVAQIGITVEIIGHEFETLESEVRSNLNNLPKEIQESEPFKKAMRAHLALADRLRFLSPMKIGGYRSREQITGEQIATYVRDFFFKTFADQQIDFLATEAFDKMVIRDLPSRIYPVFINLVNNAIYWTSQVADRHIRLDFENGLAIISDSGPGVDQEDVSRLFQIFFSRRRSGRGVGLYLSKTNLAVAGHKIRYATKDDPHPLGGANFIIEFKGVE